MADMLHIIHEFGGVENLKGKKIAMTWAYSPSYGKPLSVPQGVIGLMTRFGMDVVLAHPEGYEVMPEVEEVATEERRSIRRLLHASTNSMAEAFKDADIVYPKSWAPFAAMEKRTELYGEGDTDGIEALEKELLAQNAQHKDWCCTEELMKTTKDGKALYLHCLPADINGVSLRGRRGGGLRLRPLPHAPVQGGQLQALHHRRHDLPGQGARTPPSCPEGPGGARAPPASSASGNQINSLLSLPSSAALGPCPQGGH